jgi:hypothetical protein
LLRTRKIVWIETPAAAATSRIVKRSLWAIGLPAIEKSGAQWREEDVDF